MTRITSELGRVGVGLYEPEKILLDAITAFQQIIKQACPQARIQVTQTPVDINIRVAVPDGRSPMPKIYDYFVWVDVDGKLTGVAVKEFNQG